MVINETLKATSKKEAIQKENAYHDNWPVFGYSTRTRIVKKGSKQFEVICTRMSSAD